MTRYIDQHRDRFGVEPICRTLQIAPSTYYAAKSRPPSARARGDQALMPELQRVHAANFSVYGGRKLWRQLNRQGVQVGRDRVRRLMRRLGISGAVRGKIKRTTVPAAVAARPGDLVERRFTALAPNRLWVADLTYVATWSGFCYVAFVTDAFSRRIVGWRVSTSLRAELALDALEMAIWTRSGEKLDGLVHHSDRGVQGGFEWLSQHLESEELRWDLAGVDEPMVHCGLPCVRPVGRRASGVSTGSGSGRRSLAACRARRPQQPQACHPH
jgi:putative transposase